MKTKLKPYVLQMGLVLGLLLVSSSVAKLDSPRVSKQSIVASSYGLKLGMSANLLPEDVPILASRSDTRIPSPKNHPLSGDPSAWQHPRVAIEKEQIQMIVANQIELGNGAKLQSGQRKELLVEFLGRPDEISYVSPVREAWHFNELNLLVHVHTWTDNVEWFTLSKDN